ncbi:MAG: triacylglycerol lipase [Aquabacterium sp.]|uniref:esterase/lipase family protein n=1 Tax=Aquabacterium sp. TaxID=1872578 RepID=UPI0025BB75C5|nr:triacylglycerol lipase [Aquabacterium sp.]MBI5924901.1 triacylglycerol lipase [Aquabacterium sp.]
MTSSSLRQVCAAVAVAAAGMAAVPAQAQLLSSLFSPAKTKNPIVLVHGFIGFDNVLGIQYFYDIPNNLRKDGATVYIASVNPSQTTEFRGEELVQQMKQWAAKDGVKKFNLIGHSHGGPTVRYAAGTVPSMVASVSTMAGTHFGSKVADDILANTTPGGGFDKLATAGLKLISWLTGNKTTSDTDLLTALKALSGPGAAAFNAKFPVGAPTTACGTGPEVASVNGNSMRWYSFSGTSVKTNGWDISDAILAYTAEYFKGEANDGLVSRCSSHWGKVVKDNYDWNHLDEINQVLGGIGKNAPDPVAFYKQHANRLKLAGL